MVRALNPQHGVVREGTACHMGPGALILAILESISPAASRMFFDLSTCTLDVS